MAHVLKSDEKRPRNVNRFWHTVCYTVCARNVLAHTHTKTVCVHNVFKLNVTLFYKNKMENPCIDPGASHMLSERSTILFQHLTGLNVWIIGNRETIRVYYLLIFIVIRYH